MRGPWTGVSLAAVLAFSATGLVSAQQQPAAPVTEAAPPTEPATPPPAATPAPPTAAPAVDATPPDAGDTASDDTDGPAASSAAAAAKPNPDKRPRYAVAVLQALDKVSAETIRFEAPINQPIRYKSLIFIVRACETTAPDEPVRDAIAHVEIISQPKGPEDQAPPPAKRVFRGWMFANEPGLNLFQHPVYDAWLIACKTAAPST